MSVLTLTATIAELVKHIDTLEEKLDLLESSNHTLKDRIAWLEGMLQEEIREENEEDWEDYDE